MKEKFQINCTKINYIIFGVKIRIYTEKADWDQGVHCMVMGSRIYISVLIGGHKSLSFKPTEIKIIVIKVKDDSYIICIGSSIAGR